MILRALLVVLLSLGSGGCTLLGAGVGAGIDAAIPGPYESRPVREIAHVRPKDRIAVWLGNGARVEGRYLGSFGPTALDPEAYLVIDDEPQARFVRSSDVTALAVEVTGRGWLYGGLVGLAVDATLVVAVALAIQNMRSDHWSTDASNCLC